MFKFGWLTVTADDLAIWKQFPAAIFTLVPLDSSEDGEEYRLGLFDVGSRPYATPSRAAFARVEVASHRSNPDIGYMAQKRFPYETSRWLVGQPDRGKIWYDELETISPENVRARLAQTDAGSRGEISIGASMITIGFAQEWLAWHDAEKSAEESAHRERQIFWTMLAAISATVAGACTAIGLVWSIFHR